MFENFPYTNFHDLNLDWLLQKIMEAYSPDNPPPTGLVLSVNGDTGAVVLYRDQNVQLPDIDETSWNFFRLSDGTAEGIKFTKGGPAERIDGSQRYQIYDTGNPPPSSTPPVSSVDGMTGAVKTWANSDWPTITVPADAPANVWDLRRGLSNGDKVGIEFEYDSVNTVYKCYLKYTPSGGSPVRAELLTSANIPQSGVISVNTKTGLVTLTGEDIAVDSNSQDSIATALSDLNTAVGDKYTKPANGIPASDLASGVIPDVSGFQTKPAIMGSSGQVLGLNSQLQPVWVNQTSISGLQPAPVLPGSSGQVLGLDNQLNPVWVNQSGGGASPTVIDLSSSLESGFTETASSRNFMVIDGKKIDIYLSVTSSNPLAGQGTIIPLKLNPTTYPLLGINGSNAVYDFVVHAGLDTYANQYCLVGRLSKTTGNLSIYNRSNVAVPSGYSYTLHASAYLA